tara:strand:- start:1816 stop:2022 length:207 start_codon:yes stop_codon:yes gene_type:complete
MTSKFLGFLSRAKEEEDPVCHMKVDPKNPSGGTHVHDEKTYYFCGPGCRVAFSKDPQSYLSGEKSLDM